MVDERSSSPHHAVPLDPTGVSSMRQDDFLRTFGLEKKEVVLAVAGKIVSWGAAFGRQIIELGPICLVNEFFANGV